MILFLAEANQVFPDARLQSKVLAESEGEQITIREFRQEITQLPSFLRTTLDAEDRKAALDWIIDWKLIVADALRRGVDKTPKVQASINTAVEQIIVSEYLERRVRQQIIIPEAMLRQYYAKNREKFKLSDAIKVSHILVRWEQAAVEILEDLKRGADFSGLAHQRSLDPSRRNGGQMGWLERKIMDPVFARVVFALNKGEMSGVVHTQFGYHIIKVDDKRPPEYAPYKQVIRRIREIIRQQQTQEIVEELRKDLRQKASIKINEEVLKAMNASGNSDTSLAP